MAVDEKEICNLDLGYSSYHDVIVCRGGAGLEKLGYESDECTEEEEVHEEVCVSSLSAHALIDPMSYSFYCTPLTHNASSTLVNLAGIIW